MDDKVVHLKPPAAPPVLARTRLVALHAAAVAAAEMERDICLDAAAEMADMLGRRVAASDPARITPESMAQCLASLSRQIRKLKGDLPEPTKPGAAA